MEAKPPLHISVALEPLYGPKTITHKYSTQLFVAANFRPTLQVMVELFGCIRRQINFVLSFRGYVRDQR